MRRYRATLVAEFAIEAENIAQARYAARRIKAVGAVSGWRGFAHDANGCRYHVDLILENVKVARAPGGDDAKCRCGHAHTKGDPVCDEWGPGYDEATGEDRGGCACTSYEPGGDDAKRTP